MKFMCLLAISVFACTFTNGQTGKIKPIQLDTLTRRSLTPSEQEILRKYLNNESYIVKADKLKAIRSKMGVVKLPLSTKDLGSNGKGGVVYSERGYNMPGIKPDSTFISAMPVGRMPY